MQQFGKAYPDLRLGQLVLNAVSNDELYYIEDNELINKLESFMIESRDNITKVSGDPKEICKDFTNIIIHLVNTFEKEYNVSYEESMCIINECAKIAFMGDEERADYIESMR